MTPVSPGDQPGQLIDQLLSIADAQTQALEGGDLERFGRLADDREIVQAAIEGTRLQPADLQGLRRLVDIDRTNLALVRTLAAATDAALASLRQGQRGLTGYQQALRPQGPDTWFDLAR